MSQFEEGLNYAIKGTLLNYRTEDFNDLVEAAQRAEQHLKKGQAVAKRKQDKKGGSSHSGNPSKKENSETQGGSFPKSQGFNRRGSHPTRTVTSPPSVGGSNATIPAYRTYGRNHSGECHFASGACFECGSKDHRVRDCPKKVGNSRAPTMEAASVQRGTRSTPNVDGGADRRGATSGAASRGDGRASARTYAMRGRDEADTFQMSLLVHTLSLVP